MNNSSRTRKLAKEGKLKHISKINFAYSLMIILFFTLACNFFTPAEKEEELKIEDEIKLKNLFTDEVFKQKTGYFYEKNDKSESQLIFHLANYDLIPADQKTLEDDLAFEDNQTKILLTVNEINLEELKKAQKIRKESTESEYRINVYSDKGYQIHSSFGVGSYLEIEKIEKGIVKGNFYQKDDSGFRFNGTFTAKAIGETLKELEKTKDE